MTENIDSARRPGDLPASPSSPAGDELADLPLRAGDGMGMLPFWCITASVVALVWLLYCWPASERIDGQARALQAAQLELQAVQKENAALTAELAALDDPFYIEKVLRFQFNWRPAPQD